MTACSATRQGLLWWPSGAQAGFRPSISSIPLSTTRKWVMPSSCYWNVIHGSAPGEVLQDAEGVQIMRVLGAKYGLGHEAHRAGQGDGYRASAGTAGLDQFHPLAVPDPSVKRKNRQTGQPVRTNPQMTIIKGGPTLWTISTFISSVTSGRSPHRRTYGHDVCHQQHAAPLVGHRDGPSSGGAAAKVAAENKSVRDKIKLARHSGVEFTACIACARESGRKERTGGHGHRG